MIHIEKVMSKYKLMDDKQRVIYAIFENDRLSLIRQDGAMDFVFKDSTPSMLKSIGELIIEASKIPEVVEGD